ncbi:MAG: XisI protein [Oscillatoriales cyanobacterium SM2_2_1]|nr:XisI protein [Oscillatoriales cyanobacterium SM2_2_1]
MDRLELYRQSVKTFLKQYADSINQHPEPGIEVELVFDDEHDRYLLLDVGWEGEKRVHHCIFHFDIKDGKIWLQENNTDIEVDENLEEMGISKKEIVVGFHHPSMREYSDYALA